MEKLKFEHGKKFRTEDGGIITMKALVTINRPDLVEQRVIPYEYEKKVFLPSELTEFVEEEPEPPTLPYSFCIYE